MSTNPVLSKAWLAALATISLVGCSHSPSKAQYSPTVNVAEEIGKLDVEMKSASEMGSDLLAPEHFTKARERLADAKAAQEDGDSQEEILDDLGYARAHFVLAQKAAERAREQMRDVIISRNTAIRAGGARLYPKEFAEAEEDFRDLAEDVEDNIVVDAEDRNDVRFAYRSVELKATKKTLLGEVDSAIESARAMDADRRAPRTHERALAARRDAEAAIETRPATDDVVADLVETAAFEAKVLLEAARTLASSRGRLGEDAVVASIRRQRVVESEDRAIASAAEALRETDAEVFRSGSRIVARLAEGTFRPGRADLSLGAVRAMEAVRDLIARFPGSRVTVRAYRDADNPLAGAVLERRRGETVRSHLIRERAIVANAIEVRTLGVGESVPATAPFGGVEITIDPGSGE